jgi:predicted nucleic acid-binding protein
MSLIVDASVAVKWFAEEPQSQKAEAVLGGPEDLHAPDLILAELGNALRKKVHLGLVTSEQALDALRRAPTFFARIHPLLDLATRATEIAIDIEHPIYDCFYLALAERERLPMVSADRRLLGQKRMPRGIDVRAL